MKMTNYNHIWMRYRAGDPSICDKILYTYISYIYHELAAEGVHDLLPTGPGALLRCTTGGVHTVYSETAYRGVDRDFGGIRA